MDLVIFWNHVGREHGGLDYTTDIRNNPPEVIARTLELKEQRCRDGSPNRFIPINESTIIELAPADSSKKYLIVYSIDRGLQFSLHYKPRYPGWLIDIVAIQELRPNVYCAHDLFIDISVNTDGSYHIYDMDEYEEALSLGVMTAEQISRSLKSFHSIVTELNSKAFPCALLKELEQKYLY